MLLASLPVGALVPSEREWVGWPEYCRVRFAVASEGRDTEFGARISPAMIEDWKQRLGPAWYALHHHCYGLVLLERGRLSTDRREKLYDIDQGIREHSYALARTPMDHPMYAVMASQIGVGQQLAGNYAKAAEAFDRAIRARPTDAIGYQGKALLLRQQQKYAEALEVLLQGDSATGSKSAEINYFLGLVLLDLKDPGRARVYAEKAYAQGYPLPGLANRLARLGYPLGGSPAQGSAAAPAEAVTEP
jgi:tetratricopeptide (TPR) repeat protein